MDKETERITKCIDQLTLRVESLEKSNETLRSRNMQMEEEIKNLRENQSEELSEFANEMERRTFRLNNLVVSGVSEKVDGTIHERKLDDMIFCTKLCEDIGVKADFESITRIGKGNFTARPRLIRVKCKSLEIKNDILRNAKKLHDLPSFRGVYINPDRTKLQQRNDKFLRDELKRRKERGEDVIIRNSKIVNRHDNQNFHHRF